MTTKVHAVTNGLGNSLRFLLSSGNRNDVCMAQALLESFALKGKLFWSTRGMTAISLSTGWKNGAGSWSFPAASTQSLPEIQTGTHTRSAILWKIYSSNSKTIAVLLPDMRRRPSIFMLLSALLVSLFGYFDGFKTGSRNMPGI